MPSILTCASVIRTTTMTDRKQNRTVFGTDRLQEIRSRMDDSAPVTITGPTLLVEAFEQKDADIAWLLERESQMMGALKMMSVMALRCCDASIGRKSLDECLRDFGFTLDEVEARDER